MSWLCLGVMSPEAVALPETLSWSEVEIPYRPPATPDLVDRGGRLFAQYCAVCHGEAGEGNGVCAELLQPQPRDMTVGVYRFKSTTGSDLAADQDLYRTITVGLNGTSMPPFSSLLTGEERWAVVSFVRTLSPRFARAVSGAPIDLGQAPESPSQEQLDRGLELFSLLRCTECHGEGGRFRVDETSPCYREAGRNRALERLMIVEPADESD